MLILYKGQKVVYNILMETLKDIILSSVVGLVIGLIGYIGLCLSVPA
jgi:type III secretory pathway component EscS